MDRLSDTFFALADPTRRAILSRLSQGDAHVGELARPFGISGPAISKHLRVLERAGLIERQVDAQRRVCRVRGPALHAAHDWLVEYRRFWEESLDRLVELLEEPAAPNHHKDHRHGLKPARRNLKSASKPSVPPPSRKKRKEKP